VCVCVCVNKGLGPLGFNSRRHVGVVQLPLKTRWPTGASLWGRAQQLDKRVLTDDQTGSGGGGGAGEKCQKPKEKKHGLDYVTKTMNGKENNWLDAKHTHTHTHTHTQTTDTHTHTHTMFFCELSTTPTKTALKTTRMSTSQSHHERLAVMHFQEMETSRLGRLSRYRSGGVENHVRASLSVLRKYWHTVKLLLNFAQGVLLKSPRRGHLVQEASSYAKVTCRYPMKYIWV